jgi:hypothetical protein
VFAFWDQDSVDSFTLILIWLQEEARAIAETVFRILEASSEWDIDRCRIVGGFGKGTSTSVKVRDHNA